MKWVLIVSCATNQGEVIVSCATNQGEVFACESYSTFSTIST